MKWILINPLSQLITMIIFIIIKGVKVEKAMALHKCWHAFENGAIVSQIIIIIIVDDEDDDGGDDGDDHVWV